MNALDNDERGSIAGSKPLQGEAVSFVTGQLQLPSFRWDRGQLSACYPGYPQQSPEESDAAFRYRVERDASHVDGLLPEGPKRRRYLREHHAFLLGVPLVTSEPDASPFVVWEGSHEIVRSAFQTRLSDLDPSSWGEQDLTDCYHRAREQVFSECARIELQPRPGEAVVVHRLAVHGIAPWRSSATPSLDGRLICWFRPEIPDPGGWLNRV